MSEIAVIIDKNLSSHHAAYLSYHIAARSGSGLVAIALLHFQILEEAEIALNEYTLGARAAGIHARTLILPSLSLQAMKRLNLDFDMILLTTDFWLGNLALRKFAYRSLWPIWLVPDQRIIRHVLIVVNSYPSRSAALLNGLEISRRWHLLPTIAVIDLNKDEAGFIYELEKKAVPVLKIQDLEDEKLSEALSSQEIDLVMMDRETLSENDWNLVCCLSRIVAIYPPLIFP
jgi:hypothetical protein